MAQKRTNDEQSGDLKSREYRDQKGEVHHHTRSYVEQHGVQSRKSRGGAAPDAKQSSTTRRPAGRGSDEPAVVTGENSLKELFLVTLKDTYSAEKQMLRNMSKVSRQVSLGALREVLEQHGQETEAQIERLEQVFALLGERAKGKPCEGIEGLISEARELMVEFRKTGALDAGLIASAQAIEHYEICRYGTLKSWAEQLGLDDAARLFDETLREERNADALLTKLAEKRANRDAA